jgi:hypothetical protein
VRAEREVEMSAATLREQRMELLSALAVKFVQPRFNILICDVRQQLIPVFGIIAFTRLIFLLQTADYLGFAFFGQYS